MGIHLLLSSKGEGGKSCAIVMIDVDTLFSTKPKTVSHKKGSSWYPGITILGRCPASEIREQFFPPSDDPYSLQCDMVGERAHWMRHGTVICSNFLPGLGCGSLGVFFFLFLLLSNFTRVGEYYELRL